MIRNYWVLVAVAVLGTSIAACSAADSPTSQAGDLRAPVAAGGTGAPVPPAVISAPVKTDAGSVARPAAEGTDGKSPSAAGSPGPSSAGAGATASAKPAGAGGTSGAAGASAAAGASGAAGASAAAGAASPSAEGGSSAPDSTSEPKYAPSPNNPAECPAVAPENPVGDCLGLPIYLNCEYGDDMYWYVCTCDWYHWLCVGT